MKTIGLLGGLTYNSTAAYYLRINKNINEALGANNNGTIILNSINYQEIKKYNYQNWNAVAEILKTELQKLESFGVDALLMCNNTLHKAYNLIENSLNLSVPYFHMVDAVGEEAIKNKYRKLLLLGTKFTMTDGFYQEKLIKKYHMEVTIPEASDLESINQMIQNELTFGMVKQSSKEKLISIIQKNNCDAAILGCTELPLLLQQDEIDLPLIDTVEVHCNKAVDFMLG